MTVGSHGDFRSEVNVDFTSADATRQTGPDLLLEAVPQLFSSCPVGNFLDVVHQAVQMSLRAYLGPATQREPVHAFVMADIGKHRLHSGYALVVQPPPRGESIARHMRSLGSVSSTSARPKRLVMLPPTGIERRHHLYEQRLQRALKQAVAAGGTASPLDALAGV